MTVPAQVVGRDGGQGGQRAAELELPAVDGRARRDARDTRCGGGHRVAEAAGAALPELVMM